LGFFHAVSAFCTAGFGLFADSFSSYRDSPLVNVTIALVTIAGGIGFFVLADLSEYIRRLARRPRHRLSVHTKLALGFSAILMAGGTAAVLLTERWPAGLSLWQRFLAASFQAISASSTTGFNTIDIGKMAQASLFTLIVLMFIGSSPGGTGGGIKTTTLGVVLASALALLRGGQDTVIFKRRVALDTVYRAMTIGMAWTFLVAGATLLLTVTEKASFLQIVFEVTSAIGTVGLSMGITAGLTTLGKVVISIMMLLGRLGPLAVGFALVGRPRRRLFRYVEEPVFVG
jgi:trk system potassium uptake protein TrkH